MLFQYFVWHPLAWIKILSILWFQTSYDDYTAHKHAQVAVFDRSALQGNFRAHPSSAHS